jgi:hypothetical protein
VLWFIATDVATLVVVIAFPVLSPYLPGVMD